MRIWVFCHNAINYPSGGVKVFFKIAEALIRAGYDARVLIPGDFQGNSTEWRPFWFPNTAPVHNDLDAITSDDVVIIHEESIWCYAELKKHNPRHIMLNQGIHSSCCIPDIGYMQTKQMYRDALGVLSVSDYITDGINYLFDVPRSKIAKINPINLIEDYFKPGPKINRILIMPKRSSLYNISNAMIIKIIQERYLDKGWTVEIVKDYTLEMVAHAMSIAKIFVFLCNDAGEGLGVPPLEAAISGCKVIGFSGLGGREFFDFPNFSEIEYNDSINFIKEMDTWVERLQDTTILDYNSRAEFVHDRLSRLRQIEKFDESVTTAVGRMIYG